MDNLSTREKVIQIAGGLFREKGFNQVTVQDISDQAGISKNTFYYHFNSKNDLIKESMASLPDFLLPEIVEKLLLTDEFVERYWLLIKPHIDVFLKNGPHITLKMWHSGRIDEEKKEYILRQHKESFIRLEVISLTKAQETGEINNQSDPVELATLCFHQLVLMGFLWALHDGDFDLTKAIRNAIEVILDMKESLRRASGYLDEIY